jgi:hypothetical protein
VITYICISMSYVSIQSQSVILSSLETRYGLMDFRTRASMYASKKLKRR